jgi:hypothetical protein
MRPADQHLRGAEWSHPGHLQQPRSDRTDEHGELGLGLVGLRGQELDALGSARSAWMVARCSSDLVGRARRLAQQAIWRAVLRPPSSARRSSGAPTISALSSPDDGHTRGGRAAPGSQQRPQRLPLATAPRVAR